MTDKHSPAKCANYGRRLAAHLCHQHFAAHPAAPLTGPELRDFTPIRQVNLLVLRQLATEWQAESRRFRSPCFDFEAPAVQAALGQFLNVVSRHIALARPAFEPLLARAIADALALVALPTTAFEQLFLPADPTETITVEGLHEPLRYLDAPNKPFYETFLATLAPADELTRPALLERFDRHRAAHHKAHQPLQQLVSALSALLPLTTADLLEDGPTAAAPIAAVPAPTSAAAAAITTDAAPPTSPTPPPTPPAAEASAIPLHEKLKAAQPQSPGLAETLRATGAPTLTERAAPRVESLREAISINQRFSFINELFSGESLEYHAAIQDLDSLPTAEQAQAYVTDILSARHDWTQKNEHVAKLLKLIDRKFL